MLLLALSLPLLLFHGISENLIIKQIFLLPDVCPVLKLQHDFPTAKTVTKDKMQKEFKFSLDNFPNPCFFQTSKCKNLFKVVKSQVSKLSNTLIFWSVLGVLGISQTFDLLICNLSTKVQTLCKTLKFKFVVFYLVRSVFSSIEKMFPALPVSVTKSPKVCVFHFSCLFCFCN